MKSNQVRNSALKFICQINSQLICLKSKCYDTFGHSCSKKVFKSRYYRVIQLKLDESRNIVFLRDLIFANLPGFAFQLA